MLDFIFYFIYNYIIYKIIIIYNYIIFRVSLFIYFWYLFLWNLKLKILNKNCNIVIIINYYLSKILSIWKNIQFDFKLNNYFL